MSKMINCKNCCKDKKNLFNRYKILTYIIVLIILFSMGCSTKEQPKSESKTPTKATVKVIKVSAADLASAYESNEVKADKDYKDKTVLMNGKIESIGVVAGKTYVVLSSGKQFSVTNVQCFFTEKIEIDKVANLKKGQTVTIQGDVEGKSLNVTVNNCIIK